MWFLVVMQCWKHWDSEYSKIYTEAVYAVDKFQALDMAQARAFSKDFGAVGWHEVLECGRVKPVVVLYD